MSLTDAAPSQPDASPRWLSIIGIGEDGIDGLSAAARCLVQSAEVVFGGARHLALATSLIRGTPRTWEGPFDRAVAAVLECRGRNICVLASGDPFCHGVGSLLSAHVSPDEAVTMPAPSAFSLAASRLLWPLPQTVLLSLCGRSLDFIRPHLHTGARLLVLTSDEFAPLEVARLLCGIGFGRSELTVMESLGGPRERLRTARADGFALEAIGRLNTVAIVVVADAGARILPRAPGLADALFEHDGQITKSEIRALTLSALAPRPGELLWDIGAGSGSVGIEWLLADVSLRAIAIEQRPDRAARAARNAAQFGVPHLQIVATSAPQGLDGLAAPDAIFVGGGLTHPRMLDRVQAALRPSGRLVVNAVSLDTERLLLDCHARCGGSLTRIAISRASPIGGDSGKLQGWRAAMPITQWIWVKP